MWPLDRPRYWTITRSNTSYLGRVFFYVFSSLVRSHCAAKDKVVALGRKERAEPKVQKAQKEQTIYDIVIIGAGLSGMSAAHELKDYKSVIMEKESFKKSFWLETIFRTKTLSHTEWMQLVLRA